MAGKGKSIELFFIHGDPEGMLTATIPFQWSGHVLLFNRTQLAEALKRDESERTGVYLLLGEDEGEEKLYIGESEDIVGRIRNHAANKDWWSQAVFITSTGEQLNKAHIRYLESRLVKQAQAVGAVVLDNSVSPLPKQLSEAAEAHMEDFLANVYLILPALKIDYFLSRRANKFQPSLAHQDETRLIFELDSKIHGVSARAQVEGSRFMVLAGSTVRKEWPDKTSASAGTVKLFKELQANGILRTDEKGETLVFSEDYSFSSPSAAAALLLGQSANGPKQWKVQSTGRTYKEWEAEQIGS